MRIEYIKKYSLPILIILLYFIRCFFGYDWSDEAYYTAITKIVVEGGKYFKDITDAHMFMTVIFAPFIKIYKLIFEDYDGVILYFRILYFVFQLFSYLFAYKTLKNKIKNQLLLQIICLLPFYSTHYIRSLSYNTVPFLCIFNIIILLYSAYKSKIKQIVIAILISIATFAYPSAAILFICFLVYFIKFEKQCKNYLIASIVSVSILSICFLVNTDFSSIISGLTTSLADSAHGLGWKDKIAFLFYNIRDLTLNSYLWIVIILIIGIRLLKIKKSNKILLSEVIILIFIILIMINIKIDWKVNHSIYLFSLTNLLLYLMYNKEKSSLALFILGTSVIYAFSVFVLTDLGFFHSSEIMLFGMIGILIELFSRYSNLPINYILVIDITLMLILNFIFVYRDDYLWNLNEMIDCGSAKYLLTTEENYEKYKQINDFITENNKNNPDGRIIFYKLFPGGYLDSIKMAGTTSAWTYYDFFDISDETDTIVILDESIGFGNKDLKDLDVLKKYANEHNMKKIEYEWGTIYNK